MHKIALLLFFLPIVLLASDSTRVVVKKDPRIQKMSEKYVESQNGKIKGYRVQIHFGAEKAKAMQVKSKFLSKYQEVRAYDPYDAPYFKIRVGDFRTKLEAYKFLKDIHSEFPGSFIVADDVELPPL